VSLVKEGEKKRKIIALGSEKRWGGQQNPTGPGKEVKARTSLIRKRIGDLVGKKGISRFYERELLQLGWVGGEDNKVE